MPQRKLLVIATSGFHKLLSIIYRFTFNYPPGGKDKYITYFSSGDFNTHASYLWFPKSLLGASFVYVWNSHCTINVRKWPSAYAVGEALGQNEALFLILYKDCMASRWKMRYLLFEMDSKLVQRTCGEVVLIVSVSDVLSWKACKPATVCCGFLMSLVTFEQFHHQCLFRWLFLKDGFVGLHFKIGWIPRSFVSCGIV